MAATADGGGDGGGGGAVIGPRPKGGGPVPGGPPGACVAHIPWSLPVIAQLLRCLHGLFAPEVQAALGPLKVWARWIGERWGERADQGAT